MPNVATDNRNISKSGKAYRVCHVTLESTGNLPGARRGAFGQNLLSSIDQSPKSGWVAMAGGRVCDPPSPAAPAADPAATDTAEPGLHGDGAAERHHGRRRAGGAPADRPLQLRVLRALPPPRHLLQHQLQLPSAAPVDSTPRCPTFPGSPSTPTARCSSVRAAPTTCSFVDTTRTASTRPPPATGVTAASVPMTRR
ncbi:hypothetical protein FJT64_015824 [Amphibalanus amphitrite]|uniref:Uncharacterized protein n=1 Tax=Amphibalanus amphitrite TaxID=1232801 RepID=A0A6A4XBL6_AMPAM|nr:hypothetical protein FJT64_015824 [Amphibalanus amphitrite]